MVPYFTSEPPKENSAFEQEIERRTNTDLTILWTSPNNYDDKFNVSLASGSLPEVALNRVYPYSSAVRKAMVDGAFWEIGKYMGDYPNLSAIPKDTINNVLADDGKLYGLPRPRAVTGGLTFLINKTWLDNLGLKEPTTMEEFYQVAKAFTENDPDKNGKNDTYGFLSFVNNADLGEFSILGTPFLGASPSYNPSAPAYGNTYREENGTVVNTLFDEGMKEFLTYANKMYAEKIIPQDLVVLKQTDVSNLVKQGKVGITTGQVSGGVGISQDIKKADPASTSQFVPMQPLKGPKGYSFVMADAGFYGTFVINKDKVDEKLFKAIMKFLDYGASEEGNELFAYGVQGVHSNKKGEIYDYTDLGKAENVTAFGQLMNKYNKYLKAFYSGITDEQYAYNKKIIDEYDKINISSPYLGIVSETEMKSSRQYNKEATDLQLKIIIGKEKLEKWDEFTTKLKSDSEFQKIEAEKLDAWKKRTQK
jgi:putative aldouronate transport system substrate-binding protein